MYEKVEETIEKLNKEKATRYEEYFDSIRPKTQKDKFRRGIFALASVHTTWELNVALYSELWDLEWIRDADLLRQRIIDSRAGLVNGRTKAYTLYAAAFWQFPELFERKSGEDWFHYRDRIEDTVVGLGPAKAAFFLELNHFHDSRVPCVDTHVFQLYGVKPKDVGKVKRKDMVRMETHWDLMCEKHGVNPVTARWLYWDKKQGQEDSRYWSHILEKRPPKTMKQLEMKEVA